MHSFPCDNPFLLYRHKCFTGKYTVRKIHTKLHPGPEWCIFYILISEDIVGIISCFCPILCAISCKTLVSNIIKRKLGGLKLWILFSCGKNNILLTREALVCKILFLPLENKIHIFAPPCNILYIFHWQPDFICSDKMDKQVLVSSRCSASSSCYAVGLLRKSKCSVSLIVLGRTVPVYSVVYDFSPLYLYPKHFLLLRPVCQKFYNQWQKSWDTRTVSVISLLFQLKGNPPPPRSMLKWPELVFPNTRNIVQRGGGRKMVSRLSVRLVNDLCLRYINFWKCPKNFCHWLCIPNISYFWDLSVKNFTLFLHLNNVHLI